MLRDLLLLPKQKELIRKLKYCFSNRENLYLTGTCEIPYVVSGAIKHVEDILFYTPESFYKEKKVEVYVTHRVEQIDRRTKSVLVRNLINNSQSRFYYDCLILATGSRARKINNFSPEYENVFYLKSVKDLVRLKEYISANKVKSAAIIGSSYIGLEMAEAFILQNIETVVIEKENLPFPKSETEIQFLIKDLLLGKDIPFYGNINELKHYSENKKVKAINIDGRKLETDIVLIAAGILPNNSLAVQCRLETGTFGGLKVDSRLRTNDPFIFAAGDNIEMINFITRRPDYFPFATYAHYSGHIAGENSAGGNAIAEPVIKNTAVKIFDYSLASVGLSSSEAAASRFNYESVNAVSPNIIKVMPGSKSVFGKIIYEKGSYRILGASFLGGCEVVGYSDLISSLILSKSPARILSKINYNYTPPLSPFINLLSVLGKKIK